MRKEVEWITDALSSKNLAREMTHYRVQDNEIRATDGRLTAGHPFPHEGPFLVPGAEFEKILKRLPGDPTIEVGDGQITVKSGRSRGTIKTLPIEQWDYPGVDADAWEEAPEGLIDTLRTLKPFVSDNATQPWALGVCLYHGYAYATNNVALAGVRCESIGEIDAILPVWAAEFLIDREEGLTEWAWTDNYVAFRWENGAWMRAQLIEGKFPEQAVRMILSAEQSMPSQAISDDFRAAFGRVLPLCNGALHISSNSIAGSFGEAVFEDGVDLDLSETTMWSAKYLDPVIQRATHWQPADWPKPSLFKGEKVFGYVVGRRN